MHDSTARHPARRTSCRPDCDEHSEHVYVICYGRPVYVADRDFLADENTDYPIAHYVGHTRQRPPVKRIRSHANRSAHSIALLIPGSLDDEEAMKLAGADTPGAAIPSGTTPAHDLPNGRPTDIRPAAAGSTVGCVPDLRDVSRATTRCCDRGEVFEVAPQGLVVIQSGQRSRPSVGRPPLTVRMDVPLARARSRRSSSSGSRTCSVSSPAARRARCRRCKQR